MHRTKCTKQIKTRDASPVRSITGFVHVQKCLTDLSNINIYRMDTPNAKRTKNRLKRFHRTLFGFHLFHQSGKVCQRLTVQRSDIANWEPGTTPPETRQHHMVGDQVERHPVRTDSADAILYTTYMTLGGPTWKFGSRPTSA